MFKVNLIKYDVVRVSYFSSYWIEETVVVESLLITQQDEFFRGR